MQHRAYVAVDLGAESGRVIVGSLLPHAHSQPPRLQLHEVHRFAHEPLSINAGLFWNLPHLRDQIVQGLAAAAHHARQHNLSIVSVGVDSWAVDFVLLDAQGHPLSPPRCYRDPRHASGLPLLQRLGFESLYARTGVREMSINTLTQLAAARAAQDPILSAARRFAMIPDYLHHLLGAPVVNELTNASTTQMLDAASGTWSDAILAALELPSLLFSPPLPPGTALGTLDPAIAARTSLPADVRIVAPCSHDTASAIAAIPAQGDRWAFLSSGTWSLMGVERLDPVLTSSARAAGFTNERGPQGTVRLQKNLTGLWLVQELRRDLERQGLTLDYAQLAQAAEHAPAFRTRIHSTEPSLAAPGDAIAKLRTLAREQGDPIPDAPGELARCCFESLAMSYRRCLDDLASLAGPAAPRTDTIHIVGGGSKNTLLNQMTADATGLRVLAGPVEATAAGNVLMQALADGQLRDLADLRATVARSFELTEFTPRHAAAWNDAYARHPASQQHQP